MTGSHLQESDITEWEMTKFVPPEHKELIIDLLNNKLLWESVTPLTDSRMYMNLLNKDEDVEIYVVTDTSPETTKIKMDLLHKYYQSFDMKNVIVTSHKDMINLDILVDDGVHNLINGSYKKVLLDYPWNRYINDNQYEIVRVKNWIDIYSYIQKRIKARKEVEEITE
jgi:5'(3')-deoxyribonucleotidase